MFEIRFRSEVINIRWTIPYYDLLVELILQRQLIGLARDLRGVAFAFNTKISYMMLFDWLYPTYTPILIQALELWYHEPVVTTPVLKLFAEIAQNRSVGGSTCAKYINFTSSKNILTPTLVLKCIAFISDLSGYNSMCHHLMEFFYSGRLVKSLLVMVCTLYSLLVQVT